MEKSVGRERGKENDEKTTTTTTREGVEELSLVFS
jgi:hypothetical protein